MAIEMSLMYLEKVCQAGAAGTRNRSEGASFEGADCFAS